jgi:trimethylamine:corrinoid methyltransferase-like protein
METWTETLAVAMFENINFKADFLKQKETRALFAKEQYLPSKVIDRGSTRTWQNAGKKDSWVRAKTQTQKILHDYIRPAAPREQEKALIELVEHMASQAGMANLPVLKL